jgi:hypothetical protein
MTIIKKISLCSKSPISVGLINNLQGKGAYCPQWRFRFERQCCVRSGSGFQK